MASLVIDRFYQLSGAKGMSGWLALAMVAMVLSGCYAYTPPPVSLACLPGAAPPAPPAAPDANAPPPNGGCPAGTVAAYVQTGGYPYYYGYPYYSGYPYLFPGPFFFGFGFRHHFFFHHSHFFFRGGFHGHR